MKLELTTSAWLAFAAAAGLWFGSIYFTRDPDSRAGWTWRSIPLSFFGRLLSRITEALKPKLSFLIFIHPVSPCLIRSRCNILVSQFSPAPGNSLAANALQFHRLPPSPLRPTNILCFLAKFRPI